MPVARFQLDDGRVARFEVPEGTTPEQAQGMMEAHFSQPEQPEAPKAPQAPGNDGGEFKAGVQGFNGAVPFGERAAAAIGAVGTKLYDKTLGNNVTEGESIGELYRHARDDQAATAAANPNSYLAGTALGIAGTLPVGFSKAVASTPGLGNAANALTKASTATGNFVRGGQAATRAGKIARGATVAAATGGVYGYGGSRDELDSQGALADSATGFGLGAAGGVALPVVGAALGGVKNAILPKITNPETARLAQAALDAGIPLTRSQIGDSRFAKTMASVTKSIPFSGSQKFDERQVAAFNKAALKKAGIEAQTATPEVLTAAADKFNGRFADMTSKTGVMVDDELLSKIGQAEFEASRRLGKDATKPLQSYIDDILNSGGKIDGVTYQNTRAQLGKLAKSSNDPLLSNAYKETQKAIDDAAFKSLDSAGQKQWQDLRGQYGAFKTIEKAMTNSGAMAARGDISPAQLAIAVKASNPNYARGAGQLNDLARVGSAFVKESIPNSGSPERLAAYGTLLGAPGALAGGLSGAAVAPIAGVVGARGFNALNQSQRLVRNAVKGAGKAGGGASGALSGVVGGQTTPVVNQPTQIYVNPTVNPYQGGNLPQVNLPKTVTTVEPLSYNTEMPANGSAVTPQFMQKIAQVESGGNPNAQAKTSSAKGLYQFTNGTWKAMVSKYGDQYGIANKDIFNPQAQHVMATLMARENEQKLARAIGRPVTEGDLYAAHFLGLGGAKKLLTSLGSGEVAAKVFPEAAKANTRIFYDKMRPRTTDEVYALLQQKIA